MSIINLALQSVGLVRQPMVEMWEKMMNCINSVADIRECARKDPGFREAFTDGLFPLCQMLNILFRRLQLKGKTFQTLESATDDTIHDMFSVIVEIDPTFTESHTTKAQLKNHPMLRVSGSLLYFTPLPDMHQEVCRSSMSKRYL